MRIRCTFQIDGIAKNTPLNKGSEQDRLGYIDHICLKQCISVVIL